MKAYLTALAAAMLVVAIPAARADPFEDAHQSLVAGNLDEVLMTISVGAIAANTQNAEGFTLLHYAAQLGSAEAVKALLDRGADPTMRTKAGQAPIDLATAPAVRAELTAALAQRAATPPATGEPQAPAAR